MCEYEAACLGNGGGSSNIEELRPAQSVDDGRRVWMMLVAGAGVGGRIGTLVDEARA
jgi:hypothetical protein